MIKRARRVAEERGLLKRLAEASVTLREARGLVVLEDIEPLE